MSATPAIDRSAPVQTFPVRLRAKGQITIPEAVRERWDTAEGEILTLVEVGDLVLLSRKEPLVPRLADKIVALMAEEGVSLADLLEGLEDERKAIWAERHG